MPLQRIAGPVFAQGEELFGIADRTRGGHAARLKAARAGQLSKLPRIGEKLLADGERLLVVAELEDLRAKYDKKQAAVIDAYLGSHHDAPLTEEEEQQILAEAEESLEQERAEKESKA